MTNLRSTISANRNRTQPRMAVTACRLLAGAVAFSMLLLSGCKKDAAPLPTVTVQAEHPEQGPIAEHIIADAILAAAKELSTRPKGRRRVIYVISDGHEFGSKASLK